MAAMITFVAPGSVSFTYEGKPYRIGSEAILNPAAGEANYVLFGSSYEDVSDPDSPVSFSPEAKKDILNSLVRQLIERKFTVQIL